MAPAPRPVDVAVPVRSATFRPPPTPRIRHGSVAADATAGSRSLSRAERGELVTWVSARARQRYRPRPFGAAVGADPRPREGRIPSLYAPEGTPRAGRVGRPATGRPATGRARRRDGAGASSSRRAKRAVTGSSPPEASHGRSRRTPST